MTYNRVGFIYSPQTTNQVVLQQRGHYPETTILPMSPGSCLGGNGRRVLSGRLGHSRVLVVAAVSSSPAALAAGGVIVSLVVGVAVAVLPVGGPVRLGGVAAAGAVTAPVLLPSM